MRRRGASSHHDGLIVLQLLRRSRKHYSELSEPVSSECSEVSEAPSEKDASVELCSLFSVARCSAR